MDKEKGDRRKPEPQFFGKMKTGINGLDALLFGGLDLTQDHVVVAIKSEEPIHGTILGLQMLYGVTQSLREEQKKCKTVDKYVQEEGQNAPLFISTYLNNDKENSSFLNDLLLDTVISSCIQKMTKNYVSIQKPANGELPIIGNDFTKFFFDTSEKQDGFNDISTSMLCWLKNDTDALICEEVVYYNNRTNSLHLRKFGKNTDSISDSNKENLLFRRRYDTYEQYFSPEESSLREIVGKKLNFPFVKINFKNNNIVGQDVFSYINQVIDDVIHENTSTTTHTQPFLAIDIAGNEHLSTRNYLETKQLIDRLYDHFKLIILMVPKSYRFPVEKADIVIELKNENDEETQYLMHKLSITYSRQQSTALGYHIYKYRDYGLEIFPSLHTYFQKRRYLQRALVYTHSSVVSDTYQQYLSREQKYLIPDNQDHGVINFDSYVRNRFQNEKDNIDSLHYDYSIGYTAVNILEKILMPIMAKDFGTKDDIRDYKGSMTAIIGDGNTYKRFITFGSIFSSALAKEHTLIVLLNKDSDTTRRRLSCPARTKGREGCAYCHDCYKYIHFMDICMGNITAEELIYYLERQLEAKYEDGKYIQRVVFDDLQIIDYCFPFLAKDNLFLSALVNICRERGIYSYILCDKAGKKANELRAVSDNNICTGRDEKGNLQLYIERFIGFTNTPSKIYCGSIKKVKDLFECYYKIENGDNKRWYYRLNSMRIDDDNVSSMADFWK